MFVVVPAGTIAQQAAEEQRRANAGAGVSSDGEASGSYGSSGDEDSDGGGRYDDDGYGDGSRRPRGEEVRGLACSIVWALQNFSPAPK